MKANTAPCPLQSHHLNIVQYVQGYDIGLFFCHTIFNVNFGPEAAIFTTILLVQFKLLQMCPTSGVWHKLQIFLEDSLTFCRELDEKNDTLFTLNIWLALAAGQFSLLQRLESGA